MTEEERRIITDFVTRVSGAEAGAARPASPWGGSVPATRPNPALPPVDGEADRLLSELFSRYPEARYRITQTAFVQEAALVQAQNRIQELEWQLENTQRQAQAMQQAPQRGGLFGGMFGGGQRHSGMMPPMTPPPQPMQMPGGYAPQQVLQGGRGSGFLGSALTTAAGVAGGMVLGNALMGMFSGGAAHAASNVAQEAGFGDVGSFGQDQISTPTSSPWTDPGGQNDAVGVQDAGWGQNDAAAQDAGWGQDDATGVDYGADDGGFDEDV